MQGDPSDVVSRLEAGGEVLVPLRMAEAWQLETGDRLPLETPDGPREFRIAGLLAYSFPSSDNLGTIVLARRDVVEHFGLDGFSLLSITPPSGVGTDALEPHLPQLAERFGMEAVPVGVIRTAIGSAVGRLLVLFASLTAVGITVASLGIINTMMMSVAERTREIGALRALGLTRQQVRTMVLAEAGIMGAIGGLLGVVGGLGLAWLLMELARSPHLDLQPAWPVVPIALALLVGIVVAMLAALFPARLAARVRVSRAMHMG